MRWRRRPRFLECYSPSWSDARHRRRAVQRPGMTAAKVMTPGPGAQIAGTLVRPAETRFRPTRAPPTTRERRLSRLPRRPAPPTRTSAGSSEASSVRARVRSGVRPPTRWKEELVSRGRARMHRPSGTVACPSVAVATQRPTATVPPATWQSTAPAAASPTAETAASSRRSARLRGAARRCDLRCVSARTARAKMARASSERSAR
jgi:hypothetical protein